MDISKTDKSSRPMCSGKTKDGNACKGRAMKGKELCPIHYKASIGEPVKRKAGIKSPRKTLEVPSFMKFANNNTSSSNSKKSAFSVSVKMEDDTHQTKKEEKIEVNKEEKKEKDQEKVEKMIFTPKSPRKKTVKSLSEKRRLMSPRRQKIERN